MEKKKQEIILGILFLAILVFLGLNSEVYSARIDITENKIFTISDVSKNLFREIPEQVYITYYLTDKLKNTNAGYRQIEDILKEYAAFSNGKIKLTVIDPVKANKQEELQTYEIMQFEGGMQEARDEASVFVAYSGIVMQYLDRWRALRFVQTSDTLEYELTSNIRGLVRNNIKKVGFLIDKDDFNMIEFSKILLYTRQYFDVEELKKGEDIPPNIDTIFVIGGNLLDKFELYPIDQFLMRGGKALFATSGVNINRQYQMVIPFGQTPLMEMLKSYGVTIEPELVMENEKLSLPIVTQNNTRSQYPYYFLTFQEFASKENPITAHFGGVKFFYASPLTVAAPEGVKSEILISTSPYAVRINEQFPMNPEEVLMMYNYLGANRASSPLVAALTGNIPSFFKGKEIPKKEGAARDWVKTETASSPTRIIIAGNAEFLAPGYIDYYNYSFFLSCIDWLSNDQDLLSIRTRAQRDITLGKIQDEGKRNTASTFAIIFNLVGVPLAVIVFGVTRYLLRRKKKNA
jgi:gliding-associated putative ABC transporter substrate-binding component GldG